MAEQTSGSHLLPEEVDIAGTTAETIQDDISAVTEINPVQMVGTVTAVAGVVALGAVFKKGHDEMFGVKNHPSS